MEFLEWIGTIDGMSLETSRPVGIDLGTTFSVVAYLDADGRALTVRNAEGDLTTPSVVLFDGDDVIVGKEAVKAMSREADRVADCAKRDTGLRTYHKQVDGKQLRPEVVQAYVLKKLKNDASGAVGDFRHAVITVPAYFDEVRRKATQDAAYMAGLEVLDIINEPTAAALACGVDRGFLSPQGSSKRKQTVLVYDLGGGTFDVTIMLIEGTNFTSLATDGDVQLGGHDWDQRLVNFVADRFSQAHGTDPRSEPNVSAALWRECEDAKRTLSARKETTVVCDFAGQSLPVKITRHQFEEFSMDLLNRTEFTTGQVLKAAGLDWSSIDRILLIGGATRMPMVGQMLLRLSGKEADRSALPDEAVAHGAAIHAGLLLDQRAGRKPQFTIRNVNSHSLGIVGLDPKSGDRQTSVLIPRNTRLPAKVKRAFRTKELGQKAVVVKIVEGESALPEHCTLIGRCVVQDLPPNLPAGTPVEVKFTYSANGRLSVQVNVVGADKQVSHEIIRENGLLSAELEDWRRRIAGK